MPVGFFTQDIDFHLPHPEIPQRTILLICTVIEKAWQLLIENPPAGFILHSADEDTITELLVGIIENRLRNNGEIDGFDCALFGRVIREPKITNFNKTHPDKMPDIFFGLKREHYKIISEQDGLFVECKPVDDKHPIFSCYCKKGLIRFVNGDYAWAMQNALMVGYVKMSRHSFVNLATVLDDSAKSSTLRTMNHSVFDGYTTYQSNHKRKFKWLENRGSACPISVVHLWLPIEMN